VVIAACLLVLPARVAFADAIVVTKAMTATTVVEIFIEESVIRVELEIGMADLDAFHNLLPDETRRRIGRPPEPLVDRLRRFFTEDFVIRADSDHPLPGRVTEIEARRRVPRDEITGEPLPAEDNEGEPDPAPSFSLSNWPALMDGLDLPVSVLPNPDMGAGPITGVDGHARSVEDHVRGGHHRVPGVPREGHDTIGSDVHFNVTQGSPTFP
jgi:hypothetical protein